MSRNHHVAAALAAASLLAIAAAPARAQDTATSAPQADTAVAVDPAPDAGEIVVTAQRRSENLQQVPVAISVVGGAALQAQNIYSAETLQQVVPSLTFKRGTTNLNSTLAIRGIGTQSFSSGAEPSVSTVVDGVVYGRSGMAFQEFADIERIEVLRGPQGTLFGKNASAGALNMVTRKPSDTLTADASVSYFSGNELRGSVNVSGPLTDNISARISGVAGRYDGNIRNVYDGELVNGYKRYGVRGKIVGEFGALTAALSADYTRAEDECCADVLGTVIPNAQLTNLFLPAQRPVVPGYGNRQVNNNFRPGSTDTNAGVSLSLDLALGEHTLTSITAWRNWRNRQLRDGDFGATDSRYVASMDIDQRDDGHLNFNQYSQELRLASPTGRTLEYVAGVFLWRTDEQDNFTRSTRNCSASTLPADATGFQPCVAGASTFNYSYAPARWDTHFRSEAVFGQATLSFTDTLKLIGGLRYTHDKVNYDYSRTRIGIAAPGINPAFAAAESADADGLSGRAGLTWQATPTIMAYGNYARGYKGPSLNVFYSVGTNNLGRINPETSDAFELGVKSRLFDRALTFNVAAFSQTYHNFQANTFTTANGTVLVSLTNAGEVRTQGIETDFTWTPVRNFSLTGGYTFNDAKITDFRCATGLNATDLARCLAHNDKPLPFAPKHKLNVTGDLLIPLGDAVPFDAKLQSTVTYTSRTNFDIDQTPLAQQAPYAIVDAQIAFQSKDEKLSLAFIAKNLTDKYYTTFVTPSGDGVSAGSYARLQVPRDAERYFGVRLSARY